MSRQPFRTASGGRIDRTRPLRFRFDGRAYQGFAGDTLASALLANGVRVVGRSFRLHRPRGVMAAGAEEANAIVQLGAGAAGEPNLKATQIALFDGLEARSVNTMPSARFDLGAALGWASGLLPAGFYYKTFIWPNWGWFSPLIRRLGGLGVAPSGADPDIYSQTFAACDVLVVGAGPAGLSAALAAARAGARVILVDDKPEFGGALLGQAERIDGQPALDWVAAAERELAACAEVRLLKRTVATGWYDHNLVTLNQDDGPGAPRRRFWKVRAARVVLCAGAFERPLVFPGNDRPGVMLAGAARAYAVRFGVLAGRRAVIATNNDSAYAAALDLIDAGIDVAAVADLREDPAGPLVAAVRARGVAVHAASGPVASRGAPGLRAVTLAPLDAEGRPVARGFDVDCDLLAVSGGWSPAAHLYAQAGGRTAWNEARGQFAPVEDGLANAEVAGGARGDAGLDACRVQGGEAGVRAARACGFVADDWTAGSPVRPLEPVRTLWELGDRRGAAWVDLQNDVTSRDVRLAAQENYVSVEHLKRYTTLGMALDQGKTSNVNGAGVLSQALGRPIASLGVTRFRPPFEPTPLGVIAGRRLGPAYRPLKRLPTEPALIRSGAGLDEYGGWRRPVGFARPGEAEEAAIRREMRAVRDAVGLYDASSLGKILVGGPDAAEFLERLYVNPIARLKVGRCRYGLMLDEQGAVLDDGVVMRLAPTRFLLSVSSGAADHVAAWLEEWRQCEWPDLDVMVQPVTSQWATLTLAGPRSREALAAVAPDLDLSDQALPHMAVADAIVCGAPGRVARVSFTGERSYEISVAADLGGSLWEALIAGAERPVAVGLEAVTRLRLEKGYLLVGVDTDGATYPQDLGLGGPTAPFKPKAFVGHRSTVRAGCGPRRQLVGVEAVDPAQALPVGGHLTRPGSSLSEGWVTSSGYSPTLGRWVALAMIEAGLSRLGEVVSLADQGRRTSVRLCGVCAYDPQGERLHG